MEIRIEDFGRWVGCFYGMLRGCKRKSVGEWGMAGSQKEETITCTRLGSSSALYFIFCCHRSRKMLTFGLCSVLCPSAVKIWHLFWWRAFPTQMTWHCTSLLCDPAGFLQIKLSLFAIAALQVLLTGSLHDAWSHDTVHILSLTEERSQIIYGSNCIIAKHWSGREIIDLNKLFYSISLYLCFD